MYFTELAEMETLKTTKEGQETMTTTKEVTETNLASKAIEHETYHPHTDEADDVWKTASHAKDVFISLLDMRETVTLTETERATLAFNMLKYCECNYWLVQHNRLPVCPFNSDNK